VKIVFYRSSNLSSTVAEYSKNPFFYFQQLSSLKINFSEKCSA
jgi:hypothetical protein